MKWSILPLDLHTGLSQVPRVCFLVQQGALSPIPAVPSHLCHNSVKLSRASLSFTLDCVFFLSFSDSHLSCQYSTAQNILHSVSLSLSAVFTSFWQLHGSNPSQRNPVADLFFFLCLMLFYPRAVAHYLFFPPTSFLCKAPPPPSPPYTFQLFSFLRLLSGIITSSFAGIFIVVMSRRPAATAPTAGRGGFV